MRIFVYQQNMFIIAFIYIYICIPTYVYIYTSMHRQSSAYIHTCMHAYIYIHIYIYVYVCTYIQTYMDIHVVYTHNMYRQTYSNIRISLEMTLQRALQCDSFRELPPDLVQKNDEILSQIMLSSLVHPAVFLINHEIPSLLKIFIRHQHIQKPSRYKKGQAAAAKGCTFKPPCPSKPDRSLCHKPRLPTGIAQQGDHGYKIVVPAKKHGHDGLEDSLVAILAQICTNHG